MWVNSFDFLQTGKYVASNESGLKADIHDSCFHSLQTGKYVASSRNDIRSVDATYKFPFPSNGKVCSKNFIRSWTSCISRNSFHSLQTGKYVASDEISHFEAVPYRWFPFPSNGKVCSKRCCQASALLEGYGFHSLQTGKYVARRNIAGSSPRT